MGAIVEVTYFNTFINKDVGTNTINSSGDPGTYEDNGQWPSLPWNPVGYPTFPLKATDTAKLDYEWYLEESRIRGGFNNLSVELGPRAYIAEDNDNIKSFENSLIYSGVFNSRTDVNNTNVFSIGENITRTVDPRYGNIQFIYARDTDLTVFQQAKVNRLLIDKDAIYSADGTSTLTTAQAVLGTLTPYEGDYGISNQPESFGYYGFRRYFSDVNRGAIMRLSRDGLTEISSYGMSDYFRDKLGNINNDFKIYQQIISIVNPAFPTANTINLSSVDGLVIGMQLIVQGFNSQVLYITNIDYINNQITCDQDITATGRPANVIVERQVKDRVLGSWDAYTKNYVISIQIAPTNKSQLDNPEFDTLTFADDIRGWVSFYTYRPTKMDNLKNIFYSFNNIDLYQHNVEGQQRNNFYGQGVKPSKIEFIFNQNPSDQKVFKTINYEGYSGWKVTRIDSDETGIQDGDFNTDSVNTIQSYQEGLYTNYEGYPARAGFDRKENLYVANLVNNTQPTAGEVIFGSDITGIKGYFAVVEMQTDETTDLGGAKELFAVGSEIVKSS